MIDEIIKGVSYNYSNEKIFQDISRILGNGRANYFRMFSRNYWKEVGQNLSLEVYINK